MNTLYIKTHNITGLKYFGQTSSVCVEKYRGSGTYWSNHIKKHGYDVTTEIFMQFNEKCSEMTDVAIKFSEDNDIVNSDEWANLKVEDGLDGNPKGTKLNVPPKTAEHLHKISEALTGREAPNKGVPMSEEQKQKLRGQVRSEETKQKIGLSSTGRRHSDETKQKMSIDRMGENNSFFGKTHSQETIDKISKSNKTIVTCPHCDKTGMRGGMNRWHFNNCKQRRV